MSYSKSGFSSGALVVWASCLYQKSHRSDKPSFWLIQLILLQITMSCCTVTRKVLSPSSMRQVRVLWVFSLLITHVTMKGPNTFIELNWILEYEKNYQKFHLRKKSWNNGSGINLLLQTSLDHLQQLLFLVQLTIYFHSQTALTYQINKV